MLKLSVYTLREWRARTGSLPGHFDIIDSAGTNEVSVWTTLDTAEYIAKALERRDAIESLFMYLDRPGLIGG